MSHISVMAICTSRKDQGPSEGVHNGSSGVPMSCTQPGVSKMSDGAPAATSSPWQRDWGGVLWDRAAPERNVEAREKGETGSNVFILSAAGNFSRPVSICGDVTCAAWCCSVQA